MDKNKKQLLYYADLNSNQTKPKNKVYNKTILDTLREVNSNHNTGTIQVQTIMLQIHVFSI